MSSLFGPRSGRVKPPKRNRFDMSHQHLTTTDFGLVKPFFCKEVIGGDSVSLDPICAVRSHPIVFPINTRMRMYAHYFYVRNRTLWKDWENFIFKTKEGLTPPYLQLTPERAKKMIATGTLGDCLGVPSTLASDVPLSTEISLTSITSLGVQGLFFTTEPTFQSVLNLFVNINNGGYNVLDTPLNNVVPSSSSKLVGYFSSPLDYPLDSSFRTSTFITSASEFSRSSKVICCLLRTTNVSKTYKFGSLPFEVSLNPVRVGDSGEVYIDFSLSESDRANLISASERIVSEGDSYVFFYGSYNSIYNESGQIYLPDYSDPYFPALPDSSDLVSQGFVTNYVPSGVVDSTDNSVIGSNKFVGDNPEIPLSALPFRACEMISNYFFRNDQNNPYILNGEAQYNQFIPTTEGGPDTNEYLIHHRNWEFDAYTSAVPSPQFGAAPLVGVTYAGGREAELTFQGSDSDGVTQDYKVKVGIADDGSIQSVIDFDKGVPSGSLRELIDLSSVGISINDLRNVNAYQRFKENALRRSLRYRDQMLSHLGVNVDYPDIDVPQFIGGFSGDLVVHPVTNMAETDTAMLGDVAGKIESVIKSNHRITCYCPEHGFIIGMFCIVPIPTYSQLLPKAFTRYDAFDYFQSEFGKIGYVPIFHRELFPLQSVNPDKVFGYQRAWYDYMSSPDEVHGDFRTSLSDFVLYRTFKDEPTLNEDFTTVSSDSLNNIFAVDKVDEKYKNSEHFMVQFYHDAVFKRPIPKYGMPSLE